MRRTWIRRLLLVLCLVFFLAAVGDTAEEGAPDEPGAEALAPFVPKVAALTVGEALTYRITLAGIPAGYATLEVKRLDCWPGGRTSYYLKCRTRTNNFFSLFYEVDDTVRSYVDTGEFYSRKYEKRLNEGRYRRYQHILFDYERGMADYLGEDPDWRKVTPVMSVELPGRVLDPLAALYYLRACRLEVGKTLDLTVHTAGGNWLLSLTPEEEVALPVGRFGVRQAFVVKPRARFEGIFVRRGVMTVWLDKQTNIPLKLRVLVPVGTAEATLVKAKEADL